MNLMISLSCAQDDISQSPVSISRPNYGVEFIREGTIINGQSEYKHTFAIKIPKFPPANYSLLNCADVHELNKEQCLMLNEEIKNTETKVNKIRKKNEEEIEQAIILVPETTFPQWLKNKRRRKRDQSLGSDFCQKVSNGDVNLDDQSDWEGLLNFNPLGSIVSSLSGSTTNEDKKVLASHMCQLSDQVQFESDEIVNANKRLTSISQIINERINNVKMGIEQEQEQFLEFSSKIVSAIKDIAEDVNKINEITKKSETFIMYTIALINKLFQIQLLENKQSEWCRDFVFAILDLSRGQLSPFFVPERTIKNLLDHVIQQIEDLSANPDDPTFRLTHKNPAFYYQIQSIVYTRSNDYIYIMVTVPIYASGGLLAVYRLDVTPVPLTHNNSASTLISGLPDYFATTQKTEYYTELSVDQYNTCKGDILKVCLSQTSLRRSAQKTCAASIFYDVPEDVVKNCSITYIKEPLRGQAKKMADNTYLVRRSNENDRWIMNCGMTGPKQVKNCNHCFIKIPCNCNLLANDFEIPIQITGCNFFNDSEQITYDYGVNLPTIHALKIDLPNLKGDSLKQNSKWDINIPNISITESSVWEDVVEKDDQDMLDFKRVMKQHLNKSAMFKTKSDYLYKKTQNWSKEGFSILHKVKTIFGYNWSHNLFNLKIMNGSVEFSTAISIISILFGFFNCYMANKQ